MNSAQLAEMREAYGNQELSIESTHDDPIQQFTLWFSDAVDAQLVEPNAMTLSTANKEGKPSGRIVLLKGVEKGRFIFFTNYNSRKGQEILENPFAALTFWWDGLHRQVRIDGSITKISAEESETYFQSRPKGSQIGAWASPQSKSINSHELLSENVRALEEQYKNQETLPKPPHWGGYQIEPNEIEFWQGRANRLHDRILYTFVNGEWKKERLAP